MMKDEKVNRLPEVGETFGDGAFVVTRVVEHAGTLKIWYRRADGKPITYDTRESWRYADEFRKKES